ncbi:MAG: hypothetical protein IIY34_06670, partial [Clostridia bacterium]|nr:hypothetical protein [Clostridia bacterium]
RAAAESDIGRFTADLRERAVDILPALYVNMPSRDAMSEHIIKNTRPRTALWKYAVSGDLPIMLYELSDGDGEGLSRALKTFLLFHMRGIEADMVVLYREKGGYVRPVENFIKDKVRECALEALLGARGGVHIINALSIPGEDETLIKSCAAYVFGCGESKREKYRAPKPRSLSPRGESSLPGLTAENGFGGFSRGGYVTAAAPPAPWSHVLSNGRAGALLTTAGGGYTFFHNARENKLTPMTFDPITEPPTEVFRIICGGEEYLLERPEGEGERRAKFTAGAAEYTLKGRGFHARETVFIPMEGCAVCRIADVYNDTDAPLPIRAVFAAPLVMGAGESASLRHIVTSYDEKSGCLTARNAANADFPGETSYAYCGTMSGYTCEYEDVLSGRYDTKKTGYTRRACFCVSCDGTIAPGESVSFVIILGLLSPGETPPTAGLDARSMREELFRVKAHYADMLGASRVSSPDENLDTLLNGPLLYQAYVCRMKARTSFYQCGGAWGFRDQLQDCLSVLYIDPEAVREHILRACAHQFEEGDVQHWWHPIEPKAEGEGHRGVRSRCSDDRLWLVYTAMRYAEFTGDWDIFKEEAPFISQPPLPGGVTESYAAPKVSKERASVFMHCVRAV